MLDKILLSHKEEYLSQRGEKYFYREAARRITNSKMIQVILGPRRAGKSFFAIHLMPEDEPVGYINFDDERLISPPGVDEIMESADRVYGQPKILLLDEIQNVANWELIVNRLQRKGFKIFLTGSNSHLLSRELATHLTGRHIKISLFPFSFREIWNSLNKEGDSQLVRCEEYMKRGGFPELWTNEVDFPEYIRSLFDSVIFKDIVKRYKIRDSSALYNLARYLIVNVGSEFSFQSLSKQLNLSSVVTIKKFISHLEEAYLLFYINRFSFKTREQIRSNKKIYCYDNSYHTTAPGLFSRDLGKLLENTVAIELKRREAEEGIELWYWKNEKHEEVDFLVRQNNMALELIQVCYDVSNYRTKAREIRALLKAGKELNCRCLIVVTHNYEAAETSEWFGFVGHIRFIPIYKFLLEYP